MCGYFVGMLRTRRSSTAISLEASGNGYTYPH